MRRRSRGRQRAHGGIHTCIAPWLLVCLAIVGVLIVCAMLGRRSFFWPSPDVAVESGRVPADAANRGAALDAEKWGSFARNSSVAYRSLSPMDPTIAIDGGWKACRIVKEKDFKSVRRLSEPGGDRALKPITPRPGVSWTLEISENKTAAWLGLHRWDDRYEYGSATADAAAAELGYCRVHMPSVPRSGSTWWRELFEMATGRPTAAMWPEGGKFSERYQAFLPDDPCGSEPNVMEGKKSNGKSYPCRNLVMPDRSEPILFKSHTPYWPSFDRPQLLPDKTCMLVILVRNPLDNLDAFNRYVAKKARINLRTFLPQWAGHINHWLAAFPDTPVYVFRYEDILRDASAALRDALAALPGRWRRDEGSIAAAVEAYGPKQPLDAKCANSMSSYALSELVMLQNNYAGYLARFGYRLRLSGPD